MKDILHLQNLILDKMNMDSDKMINDDGLKQYYSKKSGEEHYRLLSYISLKNDNIIILDVGTFLGCSALAFSVNKNNKIYTFDIKNNFNLKERQRNVIYIIDDVTKSDYKEVVSSSKIILLDTFHDGIFERKFVDYLEEIGWVGFLLLDDIHLNPQMKSFWDSIKQEKNDITRIGHVTGTGLVEFK